jgi:hypothetical protein
MVRQQKYPILRFKLEQSCPEMILEILIEKVKFNKNVEKENLMKNYFQLNGYK